MNPLVLHRRVSRRRRTAVKIEFLIPRRPVSLQTRNRTNLQAWKNFVRAQAAQVWSSNLIQSGDLQLTLVYLCDISPPDTDNIVKPIQDALVGVVFSDDELVADVDCHRRSLNGTFDLTRLRRLVLAGLASRQECVYVQVSDSMSLEEYL